MKEACFVFANGNELHVVTKHGDDVSSLRFKEVGQRRYGMSQLTPPIIHLVSRLQWLMRHSECSMPVTYLFWRKHVNENDNILPTDARIARV